MDITDHIPPGVYQIKVKPMSEELYIDSINNFEMPKKIYGSLSDKATRIINTFFSRDTSTGVLLEGDKGSGKSLLAKLISVKCATEYNMPTLVISEPLFGDKFNAFIQRIEQPMIIIFDEFEKVYDKEEQTSMLTLLDGIFQSKKMFILTCNDKWRIDEHMRNRPGRIFYSISFKGMEEDEIRDYCKDCLKDKEQTEMVVKFSKFFGSFNFDILKALVEEMNRYGETVGQSMKMLNARPGEEFRGDSRFKMLLYNSKNKLLSDKHVYLGSPMHIRGDIISAYYKIGKTERCQEFDEDGILLEKCVNGRYVFANESGFTLVLEPVIDTKDYSLLF
jgi:hypothetical protein